jgi:phosphotransferase system HPr (HPr) family protein
MTHGTATIRNAHGIHCRPSAEIVKYAKVYEGEIQVSGNGQESNLRSVISLVGMGLEPGAQVTIDVAGPDEANMLESLVTLFEKHFDFPERG